MAKTQKKVSEYVPFIIAVQWLTFIHPSVGTRHNATINSNRWASRTPSQRRHQKNWVPPPLSKQSSLPDKITQYSNEDYIIGESSKGLLKRIAHRFNNGPSQMQMVPELETTEFEPRMAQRLVSPVELANNTIGELDGHAFHPELDADNDDHLTQLANRMVLGNSVTNESPAEYRSQGFIWHAK